ADKDKNMVQQKGPGLWILKNKKPEHIPVSLGISDGNFSEIISGEIQEGQEVIVESLVKQKDNNKTSRPRMF
ncbi:MAG: efflux RND transporter periplasmic adaptor subunit, partial [Nitrospirota bacterium]